MKKEWHEHNQTISEISDMEIKLDRMAKAVGETSLFGRWCRFLGRIGAKLRQKEKDKRDALREPKDS